MNRKGTSAKIYVQIPYDRYLTADERHEARADEFAYRWYRNNVYDRTGS
ncbi:hypothetical protein [Cohnella zeiphila]|uniref:Uncharacterized protein n=1 Tax=Cohnella zeiphila TaxID=2761120 RepID=A0A7X0SR43_9BACL|nr:hypothetical protein [Cohnella zeiphila]MBB6734551.1 hypothetical protein [Cohnella zeiphila]